MLWWKRSAKATESVPVQAGEIDPMLYGLARSAIDGLLSCPAVAFSKPADEVADRAMEVASAILKRLRP